MARPMAMDHFALLGLPRSVVVDTAELERRYLERSREVHPDYHQDADAGVQDQALADSAELNEAYSVLRDPYRRAEHLLTLLGGPTAGEQREMPAEFLMEVMELREEIDEVKGRSDEAAHAVREALRKRLHSARNDAFAEAAGLFERSHSIATPEPLVEIRRQLNEVKYLDGLIRELRD